MSEPICPIVVLDGANLIFSSQTASAELAGGRSSPNPQHILHALAWFRSAGWPVLCCLPAGLVRRKHDPHGQAAALAAALAPALACNQVVLVPPGADDDAFAIAMAVDTGGFIVSNDRFADHIRKQRALAGAAAADQLQAWLEVHRVPFVTMETAPAGVSPFQIDPYARSRMTTLYAAVPPPVIEAAWSKFVPSSAEPLAVAAPCASAPAVQARRAGSNATPDTTWYHDAQADCCDSSSDDDGDGYWSAGSLAMDESPQPGRLRSMEGHMAMLQAAHAHDPNAAARVARKLPRASVALLRQSKDQLKGLVHSTAGLPAPVSEALLRAVSPAHDQACVYARIRYRQALRRSDDDAEVHRLRAGGPDSPPAWLHAAYAATQCVLHSWASEWSADPEALPADMDQLARHDSTKHAMHAIISQALSS